MDHHHPGKRYTARLALKPFVQDVEQSLPTSLGSIPGASSVGKHLNEAVGQLGNRKLVADVWVRDNKVQEIDVDLNQFEPAEPNPRYDNKGVTEGGEGWPRRCGLFSASR